MASMQGRVRPSHNPKPHMLAGPLGTIDRHYEKHNSDNIDFLRCM
jgi:hypothetical protein